MPRGVRAGLAALAVLVVATAPAAGQVGVSDPGQQSQAIDRELSRYRQQYAEVSPNEVDLLAHLAVARQTKDAADLELARLDASVLEATAALSKAETARDTAQRAAADAAARLSEARAAAEAAHAALRVQAVDAYVGQGRFGALTATLQPSISEDGMTATYYAELAGGLQAGRVATARAAREAATAAEQSAALASAAAVSTEAAVRDQEAALQRARDAQRSAQQQAADEVGREEQLLATLQQQKADYASKLDQLQADSQQIAVMLSQQASSQASAPAPATTAKAAAANAAAPPSTKAPSKPPSSAPPSATSRPKTTTPSPATSAPPPASTVPSQTTASTFPQDYSTGNPPSTGVSLSYPMPGWPVVSGFGMRVDPVLNVKRMHEGIDIWAPEGTPIGAAGGGTVIWAGDRHGYGNAVFIDHGSGVVTIYAHQSKVGVSVGQHVGTGAVIGNIGHTGLAAGPHLHFEVRVNGTAYDPLKFVSPR